MIKQDTDKSRVRKNRAAEIANTFEWLITAFILAFVFRAFVMEAYRIPTGSMAETLMGAHFRLRCPQCGFGYETGFVPEMYRLPADTVPSNNVPIPYTRCPSCGYQLSNKTTSAVSNGDRILVLKCIYQLFEPKRWDVVVFKNPLDPTINYIKRLIGKPGETIEIIDGDIYVDGQIDRKPDKVQNEMWMPIYDNDYRPARPNRGSFNGHRWFQPFRNFKDSKWLLNNKDNLTVFRLDDRSENWLIYDTAIGNDFRANYAYNDVRGHKYRPYCSDLMVRFYVGGDDEKLVSFGAELSKYRIRYKAYWDSSGDMIISQTTPDGQTTELTRTRGAVRPSFKFATLVKFANVDHQLIFEIGEEKLTYDLGRAPDDAGERRPDIQPQVRIFGAGKMTLSHIAVFRDTHYISQKGFGNGEPGRATQGNPFKLEKDEFFVLGDNSPNSEDGRWWHSKGLGNNNISYREGIVPREYMVGKAVFVYWPSGFKPFARSRFAVIPNIGKMRLIYGGK